MITVQRIDGVELKFPKAVTLLVEQEQTGDLITLQDNQSRVIYVIPLMNVMDVQIDHDTKPGIVKEFKNG